MHLYHTTALSYELSFETSAASCQVRGFSHGHQRSRLSRIFYTIFGPWNVSPAQNTLWIF